MLYLLAIVLPPLALLLAGKPFQAIFSFMLWVVSIVLFFTTFFMGVALWLALVAHAMAVIANARAERRTDRIVEAMQNRRG